MADDTIVDPYALSEAEFNKQYDGRGRNPKAMNAYIPGVMGHRVAAREEAERVSEVIEAQNKTIAELKAQNDFLAGEVRRLTERSTA
jgi:hypothetical protein